MTKNLHKEYIRKLVKYVEMDQESEPEFIYEILLVMLNGRLDYFKNKKHKEEKIISSIQKSIDMINSALNDYIGEREETPEHVKALEIQRRYAWEEAFTYIGRHFLDWWD